MIVYVVITIYWTFRILFTFTILQEKIKQKSVEKDLNGSLELVDNEEDIFSECKSVFERYQAAVTIRRVSINRISFPVAFFFFYFTQLPVRNYTSLFLLFTVFYGHSNSNAGGVQLYYYKKKTKSAN